MLDASLAPNDLAPWREILPESYRILGANLFADTYLLDEGGEVHMLEIATGKISTIASSEAEFQAKLAMDSSNWQLRPLVDACRAAGKIVAPSRCYAFTISPIFREGRYEESNVWTSPLSEWLGVSGDLFQRIKDAPDGGKVKVVVEPVASGTPARTVTGLRRIFGRRS